MLLKYKRNLVAAALVMSAGLLVACNGSEDFSDADLNSPILGGDGDPADPDAEAVEVELVAGRDGVLGAKSAVVANLGYSCGGTTGYIPGAADPDGFTAFLARCPFSADSITYFIGDSADIEARIIVGSVLLPQVSGRGTAGGAGRFQFSIADLAGYPLPGRSLGTVNAVSFRAALLAALDSSASDTTDHVIEVPDAAHTVVIEQPGTTPADEFDYPDFGSFVTAWDPWLDAVEIESALTLALPSEGDAQSYASAGSNRIRSGTWVLDHNATVPYFTRVDDPGSDYDNMFLQVDMLIMPNGVVRGMGQLVQIDPEGGALNPGELDAVTLVNADETVSEELYLGGSAGQALELEGVIVDTSSLSVTGRLFSNLGYDAIQIETDGEISSDYDEDFPSRTVSDLDSDEVMRVEGSLFGSGQNLVALKAGRDGIVGASLDQSILDQLPEFYQLTFKVACWEDDQPVACSLIPEAEIGLNFPAALSETYDVENEKPRGLNNGVVRLNILPDGLIITDLDGDCSDVDGSLVDNDGATQEYLVGFISATDAERNTANIALLFSGPDAWEDDGSMPQFGSLVSGRLDLDDPLMPLYLPSDADFDAGLRGRWLDRFYSTTSLLDAVPEESRDDEYNRQILAQTIGALDGVAIDGSCDPVALP